MSGTSVLAGRVALITGGTRGIGRATAVRLAAAGCRLVLAGRTPARVDEAVDAVRGAAPGAEVLGHAADVRLEADNEALVRAAVDRFGRLDILVASAGILRARETPPRSLAEIAPEEWDAVLDVNLRGLFLSNRAALAAMIRQGGGDILNLSSRSGREGVAFDAPYSASKFGVVALSETIAEEGRPHGIRVQTVLPGTFDSEVWSQNGSLPRPADLPPVDRVAALIEFMLGLPRDTCLGPLLIDPVGASRKHLGRRPQPPAGPGLAGQVVVITGGTGGIGLATARAVARAGGRVVVGDLDPERIAAVVDRNGRLGGAPGEGHLGVACDVRSPADMDRLARAALERHGRIDALVASAGILRPRGGLPRPVVSLSLDEWRAVLDTNLRGLYLSNRAILPALLERRRGTIINVSSVQGLRGRAHDGAYCASKAGVIGLSQALHAEVRRYGVRVQAVMPDAVDTPLWDQNGPVPRPADALPPERVADLVLFMLQQPDDTTIGGPVIAPVKARRRRGAGQAAGEQEPATTAARGR